MTEYCEVCYEKRIHTTPLRKTHMLLEIRAGDAGTTFKPGQERLPGLESILELQGLDLAPIDFGYDTSVDPPMYIFLEVHCCLLHVRDAMTFYLSHVNLHMDVRVNGCEYNRSKIRALRVASVTRTMLVWGTTASSYVTSWTRRLSGVGGQTGGIDDAGRPGIWIFKSLE